MAIDPIGQDTYNGLGVPLYGDSVIRQENSSNAILTLMASTAMSAGTTGSTGRFLLGIDYKHENIPASSAIPAYTSVLTDMAVVDIDSDGGLRMVSGTTILYEINSSGLHVGSRIVVDSSGGTAFTKQQQVIFSSDGTTVQLLLAANAGKLHIVSSGISSVMVTIPTSAQTDVTAGMWWDIFCRTTAADVIDIAMIGNNTGGKVHAHYGTTQDVVTSKGISNATSGPFWVRVMCVSTIVTAPVYAVSNFLHKNSGQTTNSIYGFTECSTALTG